MDIWDRIEQIIDNGHQDPVSIVSAPKQKYKNVSITIIMARKGTYIEDLQHELLKKIQNYYTLSDKTILGYFKRTTNWDLRGSRLFVPRFGSLLLENKFTCKFVNKIQPLNPLPDLVYTGTFSGNQELIFNDIMVTKFNDASMRAGRSGLILNLQAGQGKSFLAMALIGQLKCRTLVVTHNSSILDQWVKLLGEFFHGTSIGQYYGKKNMWRSNGRNY